MLWHSDGGPPDIRLRKHLATAGFDAQLALDEQLDQHERRRLLYVACTRACDHLIVSLHRKAGGTMTAARQLAEPDFIEQLVGHLDIVVGNAVFHVPGDGFGRKRRGALAGERLHGAAPAIVNQHRDFAADGARAVVGHIQRQDVSLGKPLPVLLGDPVILCQHLLFERDRFGVVRVRVVVAG